MRIFVSVVQSGSLSSAGRQLGISPASVSRHISALEDSLGVRLLNRTSRKLTLTEAGELYFTRIEQILFQLTDANESVAQLQSQPRGTLRVHSRMLVGQLHVVPLLPAFLAQNPEIKIDLLLSNRVIDLVEENIDVDIRIGKLVDSSLIARKLVTAERFLCVSPAYLDRHPPIERPADLIAHNCLTYRINLGRVVWRFIGDDQVLEEIPVAGNLQTDSGISLLHAALAGAGVVLMPDWSVRDEIGDGRLRRLLPAYRVSHVEFDNGVYAVFQKSRYLSAKVRAFVDYLAAGFDARLK